MKIRAGIFGNKDFPYEDLENELSFLLLDEIVTIQGYLQEKLTKYANDNHILLTILPINDLKDIHMEDIYKFNYLITFNIGESITEEIEKKSYFLEYLKLSKKNIEEKVVHRIDSYFEKRKMEKGK